MRACGTDPCKEPVCVWGINNGCSACYTQERTMPRGIPSFNKCAPACVGRERDCVTSKTHPKLSSILNFQSTKGGICRASKSGVSGVPFVKYPPPPFLFFPERTDSSILACNTSFLYNQALSCPNRLQRTCSSPLPSGNVIKMFQEESSQNAAPV